MTFSFLGEGMKGCDALIKFLHEAATFQHTVNPATRELEVRFSKKDSKRNIPFFMKWLHEQGFSDTNRRFPGFLSTFVSMTADQE